MQLWSWWIYKLLFVQLHVWSVFVDIHQQVYIDVLSSPPVHQSQCCGVINDIKVSNIVVLSPATYCTHSTKKPVTTMLTYPWKCTVLHCNHLGNTWKPLVLMTQHFDYCPNASEGDNQSVWSSTPVVSRCFPGGYNVKLYISRGRLAWWLLAFLHSDSYCGIPVLSSPHVYDVYFPKGLVPCILLSSVSHFFLSITLRDDG